jgi:hypothetical protein
LTNATPSTAKRGLNEQTSLDKWLSSGNTANFLALAIEARVIQEAQAEEGKEQNTAIITAMEDRLCISLSVAVKTRFLK